MDKQSPILFDCILQDNLTIYLKLGFSGTSSQIASTVHKLDGVHFIIRLKNVPIPFIWIKDQVIFY